MPVLTLTLIGLLGGTTGQVTPQPPQDNDPSENPARYTETIVVTASAEPSEIGEVGRAMAVLNRSQIEGLPVRTVVDTLRLAPNLDVRVRGDLGMQADFSIRGATFAQTLVLVDGIPLNDSQSGHHNGDFPVPLDDIESIEILYGPASALHGADAFGGTIHVITRRDRPRGSLRFSGGSFGRTDGSLSGRLGSGERTLGLTLAGQRSDGFTSDRDYRAVEARAQAALADLTRVSLGYVHKEFGAKGFYGPAPSREWTSQALLTVDHGLGLGGRTAGWLQGFVRLHDDRFLYDVTRPELSDNQHESGSAAVSAKVHRRVRETSRLSLGAELGTDWIESSNLGDDGYDHASAFAELQGQLGGVTATPGVKIATYEGFGSAVSPSLALAGPLTASLRWRASGGHGYRVPTFTELLYSDPNHAACADLEPERAWGVDAGLDLGMPRGWSAAATVFGRWDDSVIDWVRGSPDEKWHTANVHDVKTVGLEASVRRRFGAIADLGLFYAYLDSEARRLEHLSKYLLDFARHSAGVHVNVALPSRFGLGSTATVRRFADDRESLLVDLRLSRGIGRFRLWVEGRNLLDSRTREIRGVDVPGRSFAFGFKVSTGAASSTRLSPSLARGPERGRGRLDVGLTRGSLP